MQQKYLSSLRSTLVKIIIVQARAQALEQGGDSSKIYERDIWTPPPNKYNFFFSIDYE